jgi:membrane protein implicated in regulation of membrane protease activity
MTGFFESLKPIETVFFICAFVGGALFLVRMILFFFGMGHHGVDADAGFDGDVGHAGDVGHDIGHDAGHDMGHAQGADHAGDTDSSFKFISLQSITAFFMMFGLVGLALSWQSKWPATLSIGGALAAGFFSVWVIGKLMSAMGRLQSEGTLDIRNAIGQEGTVYLTIPATGKGIVQINVQDSLRELTAVSLDKIEIKTGERVVVEDVTGGNVLVVRSV